MIAYLFIRIMTVGKIAWARFELLTHLDRMKSAAKASLVTPYRKLLARLIRQCFKTT